MNARFSRLATGALVALGAVFAAAPLSAGAPHFFHLRLRKSEPAPNDTLASSPAVINLWFTEEPQMAITKVTLMNAKGEAMSVGVPSHAKGSDNPVQASVTKALSAGRYTVRWRTASADGHAQSGDVPFVVDPARKKP